MALNKNKVIASAQRYTQKGMLDRAIKEYRSIVDEDPEDVRIWLKIGDLYTKKGSISQAIATYIRVATHYSDKGFFLKAVAVYKQILGIDPAHLEAHLNLGDLYLQLSMTPDAIAQFQLVCGVYERDGRHRESLDLLKKIVELGPEEQPNRIRLAEAYARQGDLGQAVDEFMQVLDALHGGQRHAEYIQVAERLLYLSPDQRDVSRRLSHAYLLTGDAKRALARLQLLFKSDPQHPQTLDLLARAFDGIGQRPKAIAVYRELARVCASNGDSAGHVNALTKLLRLDPNDAEALAATRGVAPSAPPEEMVGSSRGETDAGRQTGATGSDDELSPAELVARYVSDVDILVKYELYDHAFARLERALGIEPTHVAALTRKKSLAVEQQRPAVAVAALLGLAKVMEGTDPDQAMAHLGEALEFDPDNAEVTHLFRAISERMAARIGGRAPAPEPVDDGFELDLDLAAIEFDEDIGAVAGPDPARRGDFDDDAFEFDLDAFDGVDEEGIGSLLGDAADLVDDDGADLLGGAAALAPPPTPAPVSAPHPAPGGAISLGPPIDEEFADLLAVEDVPEDDEFGDLLDPGMDAPDDDEFGDLLAGSVSFSEAESIGAEVENDFGSLLSGDGDAGATGMTPSATEEAGASFGAWDLSGFDEADLDVPRPTTGAARDADLTPTPGWSDAGDELGDLLAPGSIEFVGQPGSLGDSDPDADPGLYAIEDDFPGGFDLPGDYAPDQGAPLAVAPVGAYAFDEGDDFGLDDSEEDEGDGATIAVTAEALGDLTGQKLSDVRAGRGSESPLPPPPAPWTGATPPPPPPGWPGVVPPPPAPPPTPASQLAQEFRADSPGDDGFGPPSQESGSEDSAPSFAFDDLAFASSEDGQVPAPPERLDEPPPEAPEHGVPLAEELEFGTDEALDAEEEFGGDSFADLFDNPDGSVEAPAVASPPSVPPPVPPPPPVPSPGTAAVAMRGRPVRQSEAPGAEPASASAVPATPSGRPASLAPVPPPPPPPPALMGGLAFGDLGLAAPRPAGAVRPRVGPAPAPPLQPRPGTPSPRAMAPPPPPPPVRISAPLASEPVAPTPEEAEQADRDGVTGEVDALDFDVAFDQEWEPSAPNTADTGPIGVGDEEPASEAIFGTDDDDDDDDVGYMATLALEPGMALAPEVGKTERAAEHPARAEPEAPSAPQAGFDFGDSAGEGDDAPVDPFSFDLELPGGEPHLGMADSPPAHEESSERAERISADPFDFDLDLPDLGEGMGGLEAQPSPSGAVASVSGSDEPRDPFDFDLDLPDDDAADDDAADDDAAEGGPHGSDRLGRSGDTGLEDAGLTGEHSPMDAAAVRADLDDLDFGLPAVGSDPFLGHGGGQAIQIDAAVSSLPGVNLGGEEDDEPDEFDIELLDDDDIIEEPEDEGGDASGLLAPPASGGGGLHLGDALDEEDDDDDGGDQTVMVGAASLAARSRTAQPEIYDQTFAGTVDDLDWPDLSEELAEVDFLLESGLADDARDLLNELAAVHPGHPEIATRADRLAGLDASDEEAERLLGEIESGELDDVGSIQGAQLSDLTDDDAGTHFDLGVAFKEMAQYKKALEQLDLAARSPERRAEALRVKALCYLETGAPDQAADTLEDALTSPELTLRAKVGLHYDLATAYEQLGDQPRASAHLRAILDEGVNDFLDVRARLARLGGG